MAARKNAGTGAFEPAVDSSPDEKTKTKHQTQVQKVTV